MKKYILNGHIPVEEPDLLKWATWFETADRIVGGDLINGVHISTVFLAIDTNWGGKPNGILFETKIFGGTHDGFTNRYKTWEGAERGHKIAVEMIKASMI